MFQSNAYLNNEDSANTNLGVEELEVSLSTMYPYVGWRSVVLKFSTRYSNFMQSCKYKMTSGNPKIGAVP